MVSHLLSEKTNKTKLNQTLQQAGSEMQAPGAKTGHLIILWRVPNEYSR